MTNLKIKNSNKWLFIICYSFIYLIGIIIILKSIGSFINVSDGLSQGIPVFAFVRRYIIDFFHTGKLPSYSLNVGLGENIFYSLIYYGFGDPFYILSVLFSDDNVFYAYNFIVGIKLYLAGIVFGLYILGKVNKAEERIKNDNWARAVALSIAYVFSFYTLKTGLRFSFCHYIDVLIYFPLLIWGIENTRDKEKISSKSIIAVALLGMTGFYQLYVSLVWAGIYALVIASVSIYSKKIKKSVAFLLRSLFEVLDGMAISGVIIFPAIVGFLKCPRSEGTNVRVGVSQLSYRIINELVTFVHNVNSGIPGLVVPRQSTWNLVLPVAIIFIVFGLLISKIGYLEERIILVIIIIATYSPICGSIINGFSEPQNERWMFVAMFAILAYASNYSNGLLGLWKKRYFIIPSSIAIATIFLMYYFDREITIFVAYAVTTIVIIVVIYKFEIKKYLWLLIVVNCLGNVFITLEFADNQEYVTRENYNNIIANEQQFVSYQDREAQYRVDADNGTEAFCNRGTKYNSMLCAQYYSISNSKIRDFWVNTGLITSAGDGGWQYYHLGQRDILRDIFAVGKYYDRQGQKWKYNEDYAWGIGYDESISKESIIGANSIERTALLSICAIVGNNMGNVSYEKYDDILDESIQYIDWDVVETEGINVQDGVLHIDPIDDREITLKLFNWDVYDEIYMSIDSIYNNQDISRAVLSIGDSAIFTSSKRLNDAQEKDAVTVRVYPDLNGNISIKPKNGLEYDLYNINIIGQKNALLKKELLSKTKIYDTKVGFDNILGKIDGQDKVVVIPVFYDEGWHVTINGAEQDTFEANYGLLAFRTIGESNEVMVYYKMPHFAIYIIISILGCLVYVFSICAELLVRQ